MTAIPRPQAPMDLRLLLDEPIAVVRDHLRSLLPIALVGGLLASLPNQFYLLFVGMPSFDPMSGAGLGALGAFYVIAFVAFCLQAYTQLALFWALRQRLDGHEVGVVRAFAGVARLSWLGALAAKYMIYLASACFCTIPILYFGITLAPLDAVIVHEDTGWFSAIGRCIRLSHFAPRTGRFTATITRIVIAWHAIGLVMLAVGGIAAMPAAVLSWMQAWRGLTTGLTDPSAMMLPAAISMPLNLLSTMGWAVAGLYPVALFTVLYRDVRDVSEGLDLQAAIAARLGRHPG